MESRHWRFSPGWFKGGKSTRQNFWNGGWSVGVRLWAWAVVVEVNAVLELTRFRSGAVQERRGFAIRAGALDGETGEVLSQMIFKVEAEED